MSLERTLKPCFTVKFWQFRYRKVIKVVEMAYIVRVIVLVIKLY